MSKKIIITGGTGFVGKNLINYINVNNIGQSISLNIRDPFPDQLIGDVIVHLAGKAHDLKNTSDPLEYFKVNFEKTKELFDIYLKSDVKDFIFFSSVKSVADEVTGVLTENSPAKPKTAYGRSKHQAEQYLLNHVLPSNKRLFILRPCMIHGPGNKGNLNLLYKVVKNGVPYPLGAFDNRRSFLSIDNLLFILNRIIIDESLPGGIYNLSDDDPISTNQLIKFIAEASTSKARILEVPKSIVKIVAKTGDIIGLPLNSERLKKLTEDYIVSNLKIKNLLQIDRMPTNSSDGLKKTIRSFNV